MGRSVTLVKFDSFVELKTVVKSYRRS